MTTTNAILQHIDSLPEKDKRLVLKFVEQLEANRSRFVAREGNDPWLDFSLAAAMRDMENEASPYTLADIKEALR